MSYRSSLRALVAGAALTAVAVVQGCSSVDVAAVNVVSVSVSPTTLTLFVDQSETLSATPRDGSGGALTGRTVNWTSLSPQVASVSAQGLVLGLSEGTATIQAEVEGVIGTATVEVRLRPQIVLSRFAANFEAPFGGGPTQPISTQVTNGLGGVLTGLAAAVVYEPGGAQGWLEVALSGGSTPAVLDIRALPTALVAGTHRAEVRVSAPAAGNSPQTIQVTLFVQEAPPAVAVSTAVVSFAGDAGQAIPPPQLVNVTNSGGGVLSGIQANVTYAPESGTGWLQTSFDRTTAPARLTVGVNPAGLTPGVYDAEVVVTATSAPGSSAAVRARLRFGNPPPEIEIDPPALVWEILEATVPIDPRSLTVRNRGTGTLGNLAAQIAYPGGGPQGWLSTTLGSVNAPTTLDLEINDPGFVPGEYRATLTVTSPDAINSPQAAEVLLRVLPRPSLSLSTIGATPTTITAGGSATSTISVRLFDLRGAPIVSGQHVVALEATAGTLGGLVNNGNGTYTATLTSPLLAGVSTITGTVNGQPMLDVALVTFVPGPASGATTTIVAAPVSIVANGVSTSTVTVQAIDVNGNLHTTGGAVVTLATTSGTLGPVSSVGNGTYTATLTSPTLVSTATVTGTVNGIAIVDNAVVQFTAGTPTQLTITTQPSASAASGAVFAQQPVIQLRDANGNAVGQAGVNVTAAIASGGGTLGGTATVATNASGVATFAGLSITGTTGNRTIEFTSGVLTPVTSSAINITAGAATQLAFTAQPTASDVGGVITPAVAVSARDTQGNLVPTFTGTVTVAITAGTGTAGAVLSGTLAVTAVGGVATFSTLSIDRIGTGYTLGATSGALTAATSSAFNVTGPTVTLATNKPILAEGGADNPATLTATLSRTTSAPVTVNLSYAGTATLTSDYTRSGVQIAIPAGSLTGTATISAVQDVIDEVNETVIVDITGVTNGTESGTQQVTVTITDDDSAPTLSINDVTVTEGNAGTVNAGFTVTLSAASGQTVTVNYSTSNGTATAGSDYTGIASTQLTFTPGVTTQPVNVTVLGDVVDEANETFNVNLATPTNATVSDGLGVGTITDDDSAPTLSINDVTVTEGNAGTVNAGFTVTLSAASGQTVTVNYSTSNGTATAGSDYTGIASTQLTFTPGVTTQPVNVTVLGDVVDEPNETFNVNLATPTNATISDGLGVGTITDDDTAPTVSWSAAAQSNAESVAAVTVTAELSAISGQTVTVPFTVGGGSTASNPTDYTITASPITISAGQLSASATITVVNDAANEPSETVIVSMGVPTNATTAAPTTHTVTITDDDTTPTLSINDVTVTEGNAGTVNAGFTVTLSAASGQTVTVNYSTSNGTATAGSDYTGIASTQLTFTPGVTTQPVNVTVLGDVVDEANETFNVNLATPANATISDGLGVGTITDDDTAPTVTLSVDDNNLLENGSDSPATITATLSAVSGQVVTVNLSYAGTATLTDDYTRTGAGTPAGTQIAIAAGATTGTVTVSAVQDVIDEVNETVIADIASVTNGTESGAQQVTVTITDDDTATLTINDASAPEGSLMTFTVTLDIAVQGAFTVAIGFTDVTATGGADYDNVPPAPLAFVGTAGEAVPFDVAALLDLVPLEPAETFTVTLTPSNLAILHTDTGTGAINAGL